MFLNLDRGDHLETEPFQVASSRPRSGQCQGAELFDTGFQMAVATTTTLGLWRWRLIPKAVYHGWVNYNDLTSRNNTLKWWFIYGNHPQMTLFQVCELIQFTQIMWMRHSRLSIETTWIDIGRVSGTIKDSYRVTWDTLFLNQHNYGKSPCYSWVNPRTFYGPSIP